MRGAHAKTFYNEQSIKRHLLVEVIKIIAGRFRFSAAPAGGESSALSWLPYSADFQIVKLD